MPCVLAIGMAFVAFLHAGTDAAAQVVVSESEDLGTETEPREGSEAERMQPPKGEVYTWRDGDRIRRAYLQADLVVSSEGAIASTDVEVKKTAGGSIVRVAEASQAVESLPVFRSQSGALMTLPGGVLLVFDSEWTKSRTDAFFDSNAIAMDRVSPLGEIPSGFVVDTEPGFPSLDLAKSLAGLPGVKLSSPNWWREVAIK